MNTHCHRITPLVRVVVSSGAMTLAISNVSVVEVVLAIWTGRQAPRDVRKRQATDRLAGVSDAGDPVPQSEATLALMQVIDTVFLD